MTRYRAFLLTLFLMAATTARAACPSVPTAERFSFNASGDEVTDSKTGLVWARCSLGQTWDGSACSGTVSVLTHEQALSQAQATSGWRLPNVRELMSITDKGCSAPAIDGAAFPNTALYSYWSSTPYLGVANYSWFVEFNSGGSGFRYHDSNASSLFFSARLVRIAR